MMNNKTILVLLTGILFLFSTTFAQIQNQKKFNLNFDDFDSDNKTMPEGWFKWGDFVVVVGEKADDGNVIGKVVSNEKGRFGCITYRIPADYVGDTITLTGLIKHESVKGYVGLLMRIDGFSHNEMVSFKSMSDDKIQGTNDWKEYSISLPFTDRARAIYVAGILSGQGTAWFDEFKVSIDGVDIQELELTPKFLLKDHDSDKINLAIRNSSKPLNLSTTDNLSASLDQLIEQVGDKRIVAIGESTHGTSEFYQMREIITQRLFKEKGFNLVVLESPYDDIELLNKKLQEEELNGLMKKHLLSIYQTQEMRSFLQWYKDKHLNHDIKFKGIDDSFWTFSELLDIFLRDINDKKISKLHKKIKSNIAKEAAASSKNEYTIGSSIFYNLVELENYLKSTNKLTPALEEALFNGKNTYVNYVNMKEGKRFQSRDEIMAERISFLAKNPDNKIIVWAHNAHISNEIITDNEIGIMGRDLKKEFGDDYHSIGLKTLAGSYSYIDQKFINGDHDYSDKLYKAEIRTMESFFWEKAFAINSNAYYVDISILKKELETDKIFGPVKLIGYGKETDKNNYYLPLLKLYDSLIFVKKTNATTPLDE